MSLYSIFFMSFNLMSFGWSVKIDFLVVAQMLLYRQTPSTVCIVRLSHPLRHFVTWIGFYLDYHKFPICCMMSYSIHTHTMIDVMSTKKKRLFTVFGQKLCPILENSFFFLLFTCRMLPVRFRFAPITIVDIILILPLVFQSSYRATKSLIHNLFTCSLCEYTASLYCRVDQLMWFFEEEEEERGEKYLRKLYHFPCIPNGCVP